MYIIVNGIETGIPAIVPTKRP